MPRGAYCTLFPNSSRNPLRRGVCLSFASMHGIRETRERGNLESCFCLKGTFNFMMETLIKSNDRVHIICGSIYYYYLSSPCSDRNTFKRRAKKCISLFLKLEIWMKFELMLLPKYFKFSSLIFVPYSDLSQAFLLKILTWALAGRTKKEEPKFFRTPSSFANWNNWPSGEPYFWKVNVRTLLEEQSFTWWGKIYIRNMKGVKQWKDLR